MVVSRIALIQNIVLIPGFKIAVADIDALLVHHIVHVTLIDTGGIVVLGVGQTQIGSVGIGERVIILHSGRSVVVLQESIHQPAGGIDLACKNICYGRNTIQPQIANPKQCIDIIVVKEIKLQCAGGVEQNHNFLEDSIFL